MKKNLSSIVLCAAIVLGAVSCVEPIQEGLRSPVIQPVEEGMPVQLIFGVTDGSVETKALESTPDIKTIHVFVFNPFGALIAAEKATLTDLNEAGTNTLKVNGSGDNWGDNIDPNTGNPGYPNARPWTVNLPMGTAERHMHFVANLGDDYKLPLMGSEASIMHGLITTDGADAYWQSVTLPDGTGIGAYQYDGSGTWSYVNPEDGTIHQDPVSQVGNYVPGSMTGTAPDITYQYIDSEGGSEVTYTVSRGDYIDISGHKIIDGNGLYASQATSEAVSIIPLVRNFARIKIISAEDSNFQIQTAALINYPISGYAVPYDDIHQKFVVPYTAKYMFDHKVAGQEYTPNRKAVADSLYGAPIPAAGINTSLPASTDFISAANRSVTLFMYERGLPTDDATAILVGGTLSGVQGVSPTETRYFKIEIADTDGNYFPIFRDFEYVIEIKSINGTKGFGTYKEAFENAAVGDLSSSPETKNLTRIDDGKGLSLWVSYIDHTSTSTSQTTVDLLYKFVYTNPSTHVTTDLHENVTLDLKSITGYSAAVVSTTEPELYTGAASGTPDATGQYWYKTTVTLNGSGENVMISDLHVEGEVDGTGGVVSYRKILARDVTYHVMAKENLKLNCTGITADAQNIGTRLTITLPANTLGYSLFPLDLRIETRDDTLNPANSENLAVDSGPSNFSSLNNFYFVKKVNFSEYDPESGGTNVFEVNLKTIKTTGNATWICVSDAKGNFIPTYIQLKVGEATQQVTTYTP